jgi:hypothetical protein
MITVLINWAVRKLVKEDRNIGFSTNALKGRALRGMARGMAI